MPRLFNLFRAMVIGAVLIPAAAHAQSSQEVGKTTVGQGFKAYGISLGERSDSIFVYRANRGENGTLILCGGVQVRGGARGLGVKSRNAVALTVDGKRKVRGVKWFPIISTRTELAGAEVPCHNYPSVTVPDGAEFGMEIFQRRISG